MKIYKLQVSISLVDMGEEPEGQDNAPNPTEIKHPMMVDPLDRQEKMVDKLVGMAELATGNKPMTARPMGNNMGLSETYDVPTSSFLEAIDVLSRFHDLGSRVGTPSAPLNTPGAFIPRSPWL